MKVNSNRTQKARIDIIPLIDVIFLLLIFFIYTMLSMSVHRGVELNLPTSSFAGLTQKKGVSISIMSDNTVYIDKKKTDLSEITPILSEKTKTGEEMTALLFADKNVKYNLFFQVIDKIKKAGIERISLQAEKETE